MWPVTDPEELRTRAASIFERLRQAGGRTEVAESTERATSGQLGDSGHSTDSQPDDSTGDPSDGQSDDRTHGQSDDSTRDPSDGQPDDHGQPDDSTGDATGDPVDPVTPADTSRSGIQQEPTPAAGSPGESTDAPSATDRNDPFHEPRGGSEAQPTDALQPAVAQSTDALQPAVAQSTDALQPAVAQPTDALQPAVAQPTDALQPAVAQPTDALQPAVATTTVDGEKWSRPDSDATTGEVSAPQRSVPVDMGTPLAADLSDQTARVIRPGGNSRSGGAAAVDLPPDLPTLGGPNESPRSPGWRGDRPLPRILAIANQKGGVGKTTTAVNLGAALAELGYRVLVVDLDPQGNATTGLGINARNLDASIYDVLLHDVAIEDCIEPTSLRNLFVVPATIDLAGAEIELVPVFSRELRLKRAVDRIKDDFDYTLIDCPPSLGLLTVNGLAAATEVVVPIQCEYYALEGLGQLLRNVNLVSSNLNPQLEVTTIVLTMYDARTRLAEQVVADVRSHFGDRVCRSVVPRTVRLSEAPSFGQPIIVFDSSSRGAIAYRELAKEVSGGAPQRIG
jgi:chromosome partitioning protein